MAKTYRRLRILISLVLIVLPILTAVVALLIGQHPWQPSLSDYYFVAKDGGLPRTLFLIFLAFIGCVLFAYRGLDELDDRIHNAAGIFAFGVALFPMTCDQTSHPYCVPGLWPMLHMPSAGLLYLCAVASVFYGGGPKLKKALQLLPDPQAWFARLQAIQGLSALLMTIGIVSFFIHTLLPNFLAGFRWVFWIEYAGFFGFGLYWWRLMLFVNDANTVGRAQAATFGPVPPAAPLEPSFGAPGSRAPSRELQPSPPEAWLDIP